MNTIIDPTWPDLIIQGVAFIGVVVFSSSYLKHENIRKEQKAKNISQIRQLNSYTVAELMPEEWNKQPVECDETRAIEATYGLYVAAKIAVNSRLETARVDDLKNAINEFEKHVL